MPDGLFLKNRIHPDADMDLQDSARTKLALKAAGFLDTPDDQLTEFPDKPMINGVKKFQKANGLKVDGIMDPGGPTEKAFGGQVLKNGRFTSAERLPGDWKDHPDIANPPVPKDDNPIIDRRAPKKPDIKCPRGYHPRIKRTCINPFFCYEKWECIPNPDGGGIR